MQDLELTLQELITNFKVHEIQENTRFWMVRTQGGFFYNEFTQDGFIAIGWNIIDKQTSFNSTNVEFLKERITNIYGNKRPADGINKSKRFIVEMKEGDYVLIPSQGSTEIAICKVGEYYEEEIDYKTELTNIRKIKSKESIIGEVKCPYKKRRRVEVLLKVYNRRMGYKLLRAISSYHGICDMSEYAVDILNCLYDCYIYNEDMYIPINISKNKPITAKELSSLMYAVTSLFGELMDDDYIFATANINSPGKYVPQLKKAYMYIKKGGLTFIALSVCLFGGEFGDAKMNGVVPGVIATMNELETRDVAIEKKREELKEYKLKNYLQTIEIIKASGELDDSIDVNKIASSIGIIIEIDQSLGLMTNENFANSNDEALRVEDNNIEDEEENLK